VLIRSTKRASWALSKPVTLAVPLDDHHELVHLAWNYVGSELAAVDSCGRIFVFQNHSSMGRMHLMRSGAADPDNELHALAALHWLPVAPYQEASGTVWSGTVWSATKKDAAWSYKIAKSLPAMGAFNPQKTRTALLALTRCGVLRLLYQNAEGQFQEKILELDHPLNPLDYALSHAAFSPLEGSLVVVASQTDRGRSTTAAGNVRQLARPARLYSRLCLDAAEQAGAGSETAIEPRHRGDAHDGALFGRAVDPECRNGPAAADTLRPHTSGIHSSRS
jgi:Mediator complex subunit 16